MKILLSITLIGIFFINSYSQWVQQNSGTQNRVLDVQFINSQTGWACGDNIIYKTTNAGINWVIQPNTTENFIQQIYPIDSMVIYAVGWFQTILKTTNGGAKWYTIRNGTFGNGGTFEGLYFINRNTGWICGSLKILKTTNGGETFDSNYISSDLYDIHFRNANEGIVCGEILSFYRTTNGGSNWIKIPILARDGHNFYRLSVVRDTIVYLVGSDKLVFRSLDYGVTWDSVGRVDAGSNQIYCSNFPSYDTGYAGGTYGKFYKTTNGGANWQLENTTSFTGYIASVYFYNNTTGWLVGGGGRIMYTTSGGQTPVFNNSITISDNFILHQNYPNPFNPDTRINYELRITNYVQLVIYNTQGKEISSLVNRNQSAGNYSINFNSTEFNLGSGVYFYSLVINGEVKETKKMILLK